MKTLQQLIEAKEELEQTLQGLQSDLENFNPKNDVASTDITEHYNEMLDEVHGEFMGYSASQVLENIDPICYNIGYSEFCDNLDNSDFEEYQAIEDEIADIEASIEELEEEISALEDEEQGD